MSDNKKMNELNNDQLEQDTGGLVYLDEFGQWTAEKDNLRSGEHRVLYHFKTKEAAEEYAKRRGWSTSRYCSELMLNNSEYL